MRTEDRNALIYALRQSGGYTLAELAEHYGISRQRVQQIEARECRKHGTTAPGGYASALAVEVLKATGEETRRELADLLGVSYRVVSFHAKRLGITLRPGKPGPQGLRWSDEALLDHLRTLARQLGGTPTINDIIKHSPPAHNMYYKRFGSYRAACVRAGLVCRGRGEHKRP
jgi:DNA-binding transcriptional ArsR family regulator